MKNKRFTAKILIDIGMTICLLLLMPYSLLSETAHEWIGMAMLVLFISHYILNHKWVTSVRKGKYNAFRVIQTVLVIIMLILIMGSMISGILLSNHIFKWIKISAATVSCRLRRSQAEDPHSHLNGMQKSSCHQQLSGPQGGSTSHGNGRYPR